MALSRSVIDCSICRSQLIFYLVGSVRFRSKFYFNQNSNVNSARSVDLVKGMSSPLLCAVRARLAVRASPPATWHRLVLAACRLGTCSSPGWHLPGTYLALAWHLLRGTTSSLLFGLACIPQLPAPVLVCLLGASPTGGTHSASQTHLLRRSNCMRATAVSINVQSSI